MFLWESNIILLGFVNLVPLQLLNYSFHTVAVLYIFLYPVWLTSFNLSPSFCY